MAKVVERWTWKVKAGCRDEFVELVKSWVERHGLTPRVCSFLFGAWNTVSSDLEFETEEDRQKFYDDIVDWSQPENVKLLQKLNDLRESDLTHELLQLH